jgi:hypothetical protein
VVFALIPWRVAAALRCSTTAGVIGYELATDERIEVRSDVRSFSE